MLMILQLAVHMLQPLGLFNVHKTSFARLVSQFKAFALNPTDENYAAFYVQRVTHQMLGKWFERRRLLIQVSTLHSNGLK
jgi:hypothetical protein